MMVDLGEASRFTSFPFGIEIGSGFYYLIRSGRSFRLLSTLCPHAGGEVYWEGQAQEFVCPLHGWRFDSRGRMGRRCPGLRSYPVRKKKGHLWADLS